MPRRVDDGTGPAQTVVSAAGYAPSGPLTSLSLGNGTGETRGFDGRYAPRSITLSGPFLRTWDYTVDGVGNPSAADLTVDCGTGVVSLAERTFAQPTTVEACDAVEAGPAVSVTAAAGVAFRAGQRVSLSEGFSVASGASFRAEVDGGIPAEYPLLEPKSFSYQDVQYFLTAAVGPWGSLAWAYDGIGNRETEDRDGAMDDYHYLSNGSGNTPQLDFIDLDVGQGGGTRDYAYGAAGHLDQVTAGANQIDLTTDESGRLSALDRLGETTSFAYDGRSLLARAEKPLGGTDVGWIEPVYDSQGLLYGLRRQPSPGDPVEEIAYFYFAGRPVAQRSAVSGAVRWTFLHTDHLGTPVVASDLAGADLWEGPFEPFGEDWLRGTAAGALANGLRLRLPGQWDDELWQESSLGAELYYNVHRWYEYGTGRYTRPDPLGIDGSGPNVYLYVDSNPLVNTDPDGRFIPRPCKMDDRRWCQQQCDRLKRRLVNCSCFGMPFCFGLFNYAVAQCDDWQKGCPPCPPPPPPVVDYAHGHGNCKPGQGHWHYFEYHQGPPPQCICRKVRRFGGCL